MAPNSLSSKTTIDWITLTVYVSLLVVGWMMLYAAVYDETDPYSYLDLSSAIGKQTLWLGVSLLVFVVVYVVDSNLWSSLSFPLYLSTLLLLILVLFLGTEIKGARSWFDFGLFSIQPSELAKLTTALAMSAFFSSYKRDIKRRNDFLLSLGIMGLPMLLILLQPDAGSTLIFLSFLILFFRLGLSMTYYVVGISLVMILIFSIKFSPPQVTLVLGIITMIIMAFNLKETLRNGVLSVLTIIGSIILFVNGQAIWAFALVAALIAFFGYFLFLNKKVGIALLAIPILLVGCGISFGTNLAFEQGLRPHQQDRINVWLRPERCDPHGSLYNIIQSKMAIGSGGLQGKGYLSGDMTKLNYVPEQATDFIFSTIGEEQGFIGVLGVVILFMMLLLRIVFIGERAKSKFVKCYAYSIGGIIFLHFFLNIGMTLGIMPVIGIPLPFISKGGSSLLVFSVMIAILLKMDVSRLRKT